MILAGRVSVNGEKIETPVFFVDGAEKITVDGKPVPNRGAETASRAGRTPAVYLFHKPAGCICSARDPEGRKTIYDILPEKYRNLKYVGRLDYNTSGLLLMTDSGDFARKMTLPDSEIPRTYVAKLGRTWTMDDETVGRLLKPVRRGAKIDGTIYRPMKIERLNATDFKITVTEGKKNEIRVIFDHIGLPVRKLHRISYGKYELGGLPAGKIIKS